jgi:hypothetical protein
MSELEGAYDETGYRRGGFPHDVWHGLPAMEQLRLAPRVQRALANRNTARDTSSLTADMKEWNGTPQADEWFAADIQAQQRRQIVGELYQQTRELG